MEQLEFFCCTRARDATWRVRNARGLIASAACCSLRFCRAVCQLAITAPQILPTLSILPNPRVVLMDEDIRKENDK